MIFELLVCNEATKEPRNKAFANKGIRFIGNKAFTAIRRGFSVLFKRLSFRLYPTRNKLCRYCVKRKPAMTHLKRPVDFMPYCQIYLIIKE